ncbi:MAG: hypothetical protein IRZ14_19685, partial [Chloroflexi bacterium]|nr:hypothetical protein [Chloroflexota bacterium]
FLRGRVPGARRKAKLPDGAVEMYHAGRFFTVTGQHLAGTPSTINERQDALDALYQQLFPDPQPHSNGRATLSGATTDLDDEQLLHLARSAKNGAKFAALYDRGDTSAYNGDESAADLALCQMLAFWTQRDAVRMDRLFRQSALYRPKWDERRGAETYGALTIRRAIDQTREVYEPSITPHVNGHARGATASGKASGNGDESSNRRESKANALITLALAEVAELWHTPDEAAFATIVVGGIRQHWPLRSRTFTQWLARRFYEQTTTDDKPGQAVSRDDLAAAVMTLEGIARFDGAEHAVFVRVAPDGEAGVYIDLADDQWRAVHVTPAGWEIVTDPPVRFRRSPGQRPLPVPERGGSLDELRELVNVPDDRAWALLKAWLVAALAPRGPYPLLALRGEQGSAKSTTARIIRALVDPATPDLRAEPRELRDLMIAARAGWLVALDNVSRLQDWLSDALCRLATGGGFATRELYTDADEVLFDATRPVIVTSIVNVATRPDLADRCVSLDLPPIPEERRRTEAEVWRDFETARPRIFGALLDRLVGALRERDHVRLDRLPRMADFAVLAAAAERAAGESATFLAAYAAVRTEADDDAIDASAIGPALRALLAKRPTWEGTAAELLAALGEIAGEPATRTPAWPKTARGVSGELRRLAPALRRALGVGVEFGTRAPTKKAERLIHIALQDVGARPSASSDRQHASTDAAKSSDGSSWQSSDVSSDRQNSTVSSDGWVPVSDGQASQPSEDLPYSHKGADGADDSDGSAPTARGDAEVETWMF